MVGVREKSSNIWVFENLHLFHPFVDSFFDDYIALNIISNGSYPYFYSDKQIRRCIPLSADTILIHGLLTRNVHDMTLINQLINKSSIFNEAVTKIIRKLFLIFAISFIIV